jgi:membrane protease YdiL (CAAX protease family)
MFTFRTSTAAIAFRDRVANISRATWVGLFVAVVLPCLSPFLPLVGPPMDPGVHITNSVGLTAHLAVDTVVFSHFIANVERGIIFKWFRSLALLLLVVLWERKPLASIGLRKVSWRDLAVVMGAYLLVFAIGHTLDVVLPKHLPGNFELAAMFFPFRLRVAMAVTAAITEEIESRGYLIERLEAITGSTSVAAILGYIVFFIEHFVSWDLAHALRTTLWTAALIMLYVARRSVPACMLLHFLADATALLTTSHIR